MYGLYGLDDVLERKRKGNDLEWDLDAKFYEAAATAEEDDDDTLIPPPPEEDEIGPLAYALIYGLDTAEVVDGDFDATIDYDDIPEGYSRYMNMDAMGIAVEQNDDYVVRRLIERGVDVNALDGRMKTSLYYSFPNIPMMRRLLDAGADPDQFFHFLNRQTLEDYGVSLRHYIDGEFTLAHLAAKHGKIDVLDLLAEYGADFNAVSTRFQRGFPPLHYAADADTKKVLLKHKARLRTGEPLEV